MRGWWLCLTLLVNATWADDGFASGQGGTPGALREHPTIRMVSEVVTLRVPSRQVEARFVFRNEGPACTVSMGFPEDSWDDGKERARQSFTHFQSWVDGQPMRRRWVSPPPPLASGRQYAGLWMAKVRFDRGQTRVITDRYVAGGEYTSDGLQHLSYTLVSGATWKGSIGDGLIRVLFDDSQGWVYRTHPASTQRPGQVLEWRFHDLEPNEDFSVSWQPAFTCLTVNGRREFEQFVPGIEREQAANAVRQSPARKRGDLVEMSLRQACDELGLSLSAWPKPIGYYLELRRCGRLVQCREGSITAFADGRAVRLRAAPIRQGGWMRVCLQDLVDLFGGTWHWSAKPWGLVVDLPPARA